MSLGLAIAVALGQQVWLEESFDGGIFPPAGWSEINNGNSLGWEQGHGDEALHDDYVGVNDNWLVLPELDLSGASEVYLHGLQGSAWTSYRDVNGLELSLDGGQSWQSIYRETTIGDGVSQPLELDLTPLAGFASVTLAFRYRGDFGNEWSIEWLRIDDAAPAPPPRWQNLPTTFLPAQGYTLDFEAGAPANLAVNMLDELTRRPDPRAWCNHGQLAPNLYARGQFSVEMGLAPGDPGLHRAADAIVLGLDGGGLQDWLIEFEALNHGEEPDPDDGVWLSLDGESWVPVLTDWYAATGGYVNLGRWQTVRLDLREAGLDLSGAFYLAIAQADNRAYAEYDGLAVDEIRVFAEPLLSMSGTTGGQAYDITVERCVPGAVVTTLASLKGNDPRETVYGVLELSPPLYDLGARTADAAGDALWSGTVPAFLSGRPLWLHASMHWDGLRVVSNPLEVAIQ